MEAPHHDALTHQALRGIALMSTESIQPNCSNNAAWNDPSAGMGLRLLALLGSVVLTLFNPQVRIDRRGFAIGLVGWLLAAAAAYALMDPRQCDFGDCQDLRLGSGPVEHRRNRALCKKSARFWAFGRLGTAALCSRGQYSLSACMPLPAGASRGPGMAQGR